MKPTKLISLLLILAFFSIGIVYSQEKITITTYYPSPEGVYKSMTLHPHDDFDPSGGCSDGAMYYDDSEDRGYICEDGSWQALGGLRYLGTVDVSVSTAWTSDKTETVNGPAGTRYMFLTRKRAGGIFCWKSDAKVRNQGTTSVHGEVVASGSGWTCSVKADFACFE
jgi:hypothetical protein